MLVCLTVVARMPANLPTLPSYTSYSRIQIVKDVERSNATARDHAPAALHGGPRAEGSPAGEHAPALDADGRRDGLRGNHIYGAFVLNRRVDHAPDPPVAFLSLIHI